MWPGVITAGLFSFLLAYNDFAVTSLLLSDENRTMIPKIAAFLGTTYTEEHNVCSSSSYFCNGPLVLVMFFKKRL